MSRREACPACSGENIKHVFVANGYDIKRCVACGTLFVANLPSPEALTAIYTSSNFYELQPYSIRRNEDENLRRLKIIKRLKPGGKLLDIGCAHGLLLDQAAGQGYETFGIEPSFRYAEEAAHKGHAVFNGGLEEFAAQRPDERFDIIVCLDVIEHITAPRAFLSLAASLLSESGIMVVSTPNYSGVIAKLLGAHDPYMTPPVHTVFLTAAGMRRIAAAAGLEVFRFLTFGRLVAVEMDRAVERYCPRPFHFLRPVLRPAITFAFWMLNLMKLGLEQEIYLSRAR